MKLFEYVGGNQFRLINETHIPSYSGYYKDGKDITTTVPENQLPIKLSDLFTPKTEYLASDDKEGLEYIENLKNTAKFLWAKKVPGYGYINNSFRRSEPNDFCYEVNISYHDTYLNGDNQMLFGVSKDGKHIQVFAS
jgi:hypothetical protein